VLYVPVAVIDIYAKAGLARLQSSLGGASAVQPLGLRAECEYFNVGGANSGLASLGITWTFF
jgi:hypothetical protein